MLYHVWECDSIDPSLKKEFDEDLKIKFDESKHLVPESVGDAHSIKDAILNSVKGFDEIQNMLIVSLTQQLKSIGFIKENDSRELKLERLWANRMRTGAAAKLHWHNTRFVMVYYHHAPENSAELVFIHPKHSAKKFSQEIDFSDNDKLKLVPKTQTCIFHDGNIPHAVAEHKHQEDRISIILEFSFERNYKKIFAKLKEL